MTIINDANMFFVFGIWLLSRLFGKLVTHHVKEGVYACLLVYRCTQKGTKSQNSELLYSQIN